MFTGLVEDKGRIVSSRRTGDDIRLEVQTALPLHEVKLGDSIAVNGCCLTATALGRGTFSADASVETVQRTSLGALRQGSEVHLERAMRLSDRLDGHIVQGHVDGLGTVVRNERDGRAWQLWIDVPPALHRDLCDKGSVAVDGVSLTINELTATGFRLTIVPFSSEKTLLAGYARGQVVNIETDIIGKYVRRLMQGAGSSEGPVESMLKRYGYLG
jgi:riboflavin synthase